jgi:hypothetical protein
MRGSGLSFRSSDRPRARALIIFEKIINNVVI